MDVAVLPFTPSPSVTANASASHAAAGSASTTNAAAANATAGAPSGEQPVDLNNPHVVATSADLFAKLLAKQVGADAELKKPVTVDASLATDPAAALIDPAVLQQQAALFMVVPLQAQVQANIQTPVQAPVQAAIQTSVQAPVLAAVIAPNDTNVLPQVAGVPSASTSPAPGVVLADSKAEVPRQPLAANSAAIAAPNAAASGLPDKIFSLKAAQAESQSAANQPAMMPTPVSLPAQTPVSQNNAVQPSSNIPQAVGHSAWGDMLGNRVVWMVSQQHQSVELHLNPPALGPLEVHLSMSDGQANLSFTTQHQPVKEAIESATSRLKEMLGESGISMGSVSVNVGSFTQPNQQPQDGQAQARAGRSSWAEQTPVVDISAMQASTARMLSRNGMVDIFA